ncbi:hypothetical protein COB80_00855 [Candidatus Kaiserbacteria bacterium]|nr:MAG: hypothetical protein COB80_00855 [Candidatus Kaiserbacteria bacterium]
MDQSREEAIEVARNQLAEGTWPEVMVLALYQNPDAPRTSSKEFLRLKKFFQDAGCPNMATVAELVCFEELEKGITMSFNVTLRSRQGTSRGGNFLSYPDLLVGTLEGDTGAGDWFRQFSKDMPRLIPEPVQIVDKIFGEVVELFVHYDIRGNA